MTIADVERRPPETPAPAADIQTRRARFVHDATSAVGLARRGGTSVIERLPATVRATRAGAHEATNSLQRLPDSTLRSLIVGAVGLAAGFQLAGAPRLVRAAGVAPALFMGAAIVLRPTNPVVPVPDLGDEPLGGSSAG